MVGGMMQAEGLGDPPRSMKDRVTGTKCLGTS